jgi:hypothetical protein
VYKEEIINAARDSVIGKKYMSFVLYSTDSSAAVVDVFFGNPKSDWRSALDVASQRAEDWCSNAGAESLELLPELDEDACVEFCCNIPLQTADMSSDCAYHVNYVEMK